MNEELSKIEELINKIPYPHTLVLDMRRSINHWFLEFEYFVIRPDFRVRDLQRKSRLVPWLYKGDKYSNEKYVDLDASCQSVANETIKKSISRYWSGRIEVGSVTVIAYTDQIVEKDSAIFCLYAKSGKYLGIYCHSLDWVEDIVRIGDDLKPFFDFDTAIKELSKITSIENNYKIPRKPLSKAQSLRYEDLLNSDEYLILDAEFGFVISFDLYKRFLDEQIIPLTGGELYYDELKPVSNEENLQFVWKVKQKEYLFELYNKGDYIDAESFYKTLNQILDDLGTGRKFVAFREVNFGQDYGLAYINEEKKKQLKNLFFIRLI